MYLATKNSLNLKESGALRPRGVDQIKEVRAKGKFGNFKTG